MTTKVYKFLGIDTAMHLLRPGAKWEISNNVFTRWDDPRPCPSIEEVYWSTISEIVLLPFTCASTPDMATVVITGRDISLSFTGGTDIEAQATSAVLTKTNLRETYQTLDGEAYKTTNIEAINACTTLDQLKKLYTSLSKDEQGHPDVIKAKDNKKGGLV